MSTIGPETLGRLFREHGPALRLFARQWGPGADDLVQEAFLTLVRQPRLPDPVRPWLYRVVRHRAIEAARAARRRRGREAVAAPREAWFTAADDQLDADDATAALAELPVALREIIVARLWGGLTFEEVAHLVGCSLTTAHRRYQQGLAELRSRLEGPCPPHPISRSAT